MLTASLFTTLLLASAVTAHPVERSAPLKSVTFTKQINPGAQFGDIVKQEQQRIRCLEARIEGILSKGGSPLTIPDECQVLSSPATNKVVSYIASVGVGSPATQYDLIIDTGSSNTWVGATKPYHPTSTSHKTDDTVSVTYGSGSFSGNEFIDRVDLGNDLVIERQSIGVAKTSTGFTGVDGIIGVGPVDLTLDTLSPDTKRTIPTVTDNFFQLGLTAADILSVSFEPTTTDSEMNGELTWGGVDFTKFTGEITYTPVTDTSPASRFWGIDASVTYDNGTPILSSTAGIVDTGTTLVLLATNAFQAYQKATGGVPDNATGLLKITSAQFDNLQSLFFEVAGVKFELTPNGQIWPRSLNSAIGGTADGIYLIVSDLGTTSGQGLDFILGQTFLERFYSVFDTGNKRVGLATTAFTHATTN